MSLLEPVLFLIFISDVVSLSWDNTTMESFTDNVELYCVYSMRNAHGPQLYTSPLLN